MKFYVKQTGQNRYAGGSFRWLRIRDIIIEKSNIAIEVKTARRGILFMDMPLDLDPPNAIFKDEYGDYVPLSKVLKSWTSLVY